MSRAFDGILSMVRETVELPMFIMFDMVDTLKPALCNFQIMLFLALRSIGVKVVFMVIHRFRVAYIVGECKIKV